MSSEKKTLSEKKSFMERIRMANTRQWVKFALVVLLILAFLIWSGAWWLLLLIPLALDIYITKYVPWGGWKNTENPILKWLAEWVDAIVFALVAVYIVNLYIFQNYKIPSPSLEKTLRVGDFLFVSKMSYGPRCPMTPLSFPLAQHTLPLLNIKSYIEHPQWEYKRLKGFGSVQRGDIVVFNFPAGDTVALNLQSADYYSLVHTFGRDAVWSNKRKFGDIVVRPVDRRENYVKRCVGLPGDTLQIINGVVYTNGQAEKKMPGIQANYLVETSGALNPKFLEKLEVRKEDRLLLDPMSARNLGYGDSTGALPYVYRLPLTKKALEEMKNHPGVVSVKNEPAFISGETFPINMPKTWTRDDYGPIYIPKKGDKIKLEVATLPLYEQIIRNYERNELKVADGKIYINGQVADSYTFKMDYYWMMGDNRHNSADSRFWGYVPEDHIVGKPLFIWLSLDEDKSFPFNIRWSRMFTMVHAD
jgi:signal peptidase I, bacterial type